MLRHSIRRLNRNSRHRFIHWLSSSISSDPVPQPELLTRRLCRLLTLHRYDAVLRLRFHFSDTILLAVLYQVRLDPTACLTFFNLALKQPRYRPGFKPYCAVVHILSNAKMYGDARVLLNQCIDIYVLSNDSDFYSIDVVWMELVSVYREFRFSKTVFDMCLKAYCEKGLLGDALYVFDHMPQCGARPSLRSCNSLLSGLVKKGEYGVVLSVYDQVVRMGFLPDVFMCSIVVNAYCKSWRVEKAVEFVKDMEVRLGLEPNVVTYNSLINGFVMKDDLGGAEMVVGLMGDKGVAKNVATYTILMSGYSRKGRMSEAESLFCRMKEELVVDGHPYGVLINGFCRIGKMDDAARIRDDMLSSGLKMNLVLCNSLINGYCKNGQVKEAESVISQMSEWGLKPDCYSFSTLVDGYCKEGRTSEAFDVWEMMLSQGVKPTVVTYNILLRGLCRVGAMDDAARVWELMMERGMKPNEVSYCTFLDGFLKMGWLDDAFRLWKIGLAKGLAKSNVAFNTMLSGLCRLGKMDEAEEVFQKMIDLGCSPDAITYRILSDGFRRVGDVEQASKVYTKYRAFVATKCHLRSPPLVTSPTSDHPSPTHASLDHQTPTPAASSLSAALPRSVPNEVKAENLVLEPVKKRMSIWQRQLTCRTLPTLPRSVPYDEVS